MRDIRNNVYHDEDDVNACSLSDDEKLRLDDEHYQQLQQENDFLRAQLAEASYQLPVSDWRCFMGCAISSSSGAPF